MASALPVVPKKSGWAFLILGENNFAFIYSLFRGGLKEGGWG